MIIGIKSHIPEETHTVVRALTFAFGEARVINLYEEAVETLVDLIDVPYDFYYTQRGRATVPSDPPTPQHAGLNVGSLLELFKGNNLETAIKAAKKAKRLIAKGKARFVIIEDIIHDGETVVIKREEPKAIIIALDSDEYKEYKQNGYDYVLPTHPTQDGIWSVIKSIEEGRN